MQLLCRLQPPDVFDYNSTVVNFEDITIPTAGISMEKESRRRKMTVINFRRELCLLGCREGKQGCGLITYSVKSSWPKLEESSSKATSVKSIERYSPRSTGQERSVPFRTRQRRILSQPHDTILKQKRSHLHPRFPKLINPKPGMIGT